MSPPRTARRLPQSPAHRFRMARVILALVLREMSTTYGRSPGGYVWAILQPVGIILILAVGFSLVLRAPSLGTSFLLFYASALLPLRMFQDMSLNVGAAVSFNRALMEYPRVTIMDAVLARAILVLLTQTVVSALIFTGIFLVEDIPETINLPPIVTAFALAAFLGFGFGMFNCYAMVAFPVWKTLWGVLTRPLILVSGVFYLYEDLPRGIQDLLWYNPLLHIAGLAREGVYSIYQPGYISIILIAGTALAPMFLGTLLLFRFGRSMLYK